MLWHHSGNWNLLTEFLRISIDSRLCFTPAYPTLSDIHIYMRHHRQTRYKPRKYNKLKESRKRPTHKVSFESASRDRCAFRVQGSFFDMAHISFSLIEWWWCKAAIHFVVSLAGLTRSPWCSLYVGYLSRPVHDCADARRPKTYSSSRLPFGLGQQKKISGKTDLISMSGQ